MSKEQYVNLIQDGRLYPSFIMKNFKEYKIPEYLSKGEDPCNIETKLELRKYQEFIGKYLGPKSPYNSILLSHMMGSGKTITAINLINILYNYSRDINFIILIKASLHDDPWMKDLKIWLGMGSSEESKLSRYATLHFVHYDSPYADKDFISTMKSVDTSKRMVYIIDEAHNFIRNVYSNINSRIGSRAQKIYDYILREKRENKNTKIVLISATPAINTPFELALTFNLLRPNIFPSSEAEFNRTFITDSVYPILNPTKRNLFQRRILGLVSYYIGSTPDLYARQELHMVDLPMSSYQYNIYRVFEKKESEIQQKARRYGKQSQLYKTYTRQASNFVFPYVNTRITGEIRPRPGQFKISDKTAENISKGKAVELGESEKDLINKYIKTLEYFIIETEKFFFRIKSEDINQTIELDLDDFKTNFDSYNQEFIKFYLNGKKKSGLFNQMYDCSPKMTAIAFMIHVSPGKAMVYTNYVVMEGIDMMKIYLKLIGFTSYTGGTEDKLTYCEYHGRISKEDRIKIKNSFNQKNNIRGNICKVILLSPSATEGIQLLNIRQEHIMEPYWTEVRIQQVQGRGIRQCSHKDLPMEERLVQIYRYKVIKPEILDDDDTVRISTDEYIEDAAKAKASLIESFLSATKEAAADCELFRNHNMMTQSYQCFQFPQSTLMGKNVGPAYKEDIKDDIKYDSGLNAKNSRVERIKVIKILAVYVLNKDSVEPEYSAPYNYWYHVKSGMCYDFDTHYPVGQVQFINGLPNKLNKDTYIMSDLINIPSIGDSINP